MPDRLHRLLVWPLWSWRNLTISVIGTLLAVTLLGKASSAMTPGPAPSPRPAVTTTTTMSTAPSERATTIPPTADPGTAVQSIPSIPGPSSTPPPPAASRSTAAAATTKDSCEAVASRFVTAWARPTLPARVWLDGMRGEATPAFLAQLAESEPARVPATTVIGQPETVSAAKPLSTFRFVTDGGRVDVITQQHGGICRVSDLQPAEDVPGAPTPILTARPGPAAAGPTGATPGRPGLGG